MELASGTHIMVKTGESTEAFSAALAPEGILLWIAGERHRHQMPHQQRILWFPRITWAGVTSQMKRLRTRQSRADADSMPRA